MNVFNAFHTVTVTLTVTVTVTVTVKGNFSLPNLKNILYVNCVKKNIVYKRHNILRYNFFQISDHSDNLFLFLKKNKTSTVLKWAGPRGNLGLLIFIFCYLIVANSPTQHVTSSSVFRTRCKVPEFMAYQQSIINLFPTKKLQKKILEIIVKIKFSCFATN